MATRRGPAIGPNNATALASKHDTFLCRSCAKAVRTVANATSWAPVRLYRITHATGRRDAKEGAKMIDSMLRAIVSSFIQGFGAYGFAIGSGL